MKTSDPKVIRKITLIDWASQNYGKKAPHANTLRKWARTGQISPAPVLTGRAYMVHPKATYSPKSAK